ncbi:MAG: hypothetical protein AVDCRST_MAG03-3724, partial [uncultured Rubrobacteraceae bacterium]
GQAHGALRAPRRPRGLRGVLRQHPHAHGPQDTKPPQVRGGKGTRDPRRWRAALLPHLRGVLREHGADAGGHVHARGAGAPRGPSELRHGRGDDLYIRDRRV